MLRRVVICMALMVVLLSGGCENVSPRGVSALVLSFSIGFIILSWPVVILLTLLGRRLNLVCNRVVLLQYGVYVLIQVIIPLSMGLFSGDFIVVIYIIVFIQLFSIPYLLLIGGLLILVLPVRLLAWVPTFLLVPHYLMFGFLYVTNPKWPQMDVTTVALMSILWNVAIPVGVVILVGLLIRRRMKDETLGGMDRIGVCECCGRKDVPEKDLAKIDSGQQLCPDCLRMLRD